MREKRDYFEHLAAKGVVQVLLDLDPREEVLDLPGHLWNGAGSVALNFSHKFGTPLKIGEQGVGQPLSFPGHGHYQVYVPWSAVYCIQGPNLEFKAWEHQALTESPPSTLAAPQYGGVQSNHSMAPARQFKKGRPKLSILPGGVARSEPTPSPAAVGHLHLVK